MYETKAEAIACPKADMRLVEHLDAGLVYNSQYRSGLMYVDSNTKCNFE
jgi:hypothetical protein